MKIRFPDPVADMARAVGHPVRARLLAVVRGAPGGLTTPQIAALLDGAIGDRELRRHLEVLEGVGLVEVQRHPTNGHGLTNTYRPTDPAGTA